MNKFKYILLAGALASSAMFTACDKDDEEFEYASRIAGDFVGSENCDGDVVGPYEVHIYNTAANDPNVVWVENIWDYAPKVRATVSGNTFNVASQQVIAGGDTFNIISGQGTVDGDKLNFNFSIDYHGDTYTCSFDGVKDEILPAVGG